MQKGTDRLNRFQRQDMKRSVKVVEDIDSHAFDRNKRFQPAARLLDSLTAPMLTQFRHMVRTRHDAKNPRFLCWKCGRPVYVSLSGARIASDRDGRDAFFAHHAGTAEDCEWGTGGQNPRDIDALKYEGVQEGAQHKYLKSSLALMLEADPAFDNVTIECVVQRPYGWRKPDVSAKFCGREVAFDLQLSTTQLPEIVARQNFYEQSGIYYMWVTRSNDPLRLFSQAFQDIYWKKNSGQIFAIDSQAEAISLEKRILHIWALTVMPRLKRAGWSNVWERRLVSRDDIEWDTPSGRPICSGADYSVAALELSERHFHDTRRQLIRAVKRPDPEEFEGIPDTQYEQLDSLYGAKFIDEMGNRHTREKEWDERIAEKKAAKAWNEIARKFGSPLWKEARQDKLFRAIGILASIALNKKMDSSRFRPDQMTAILNNFLEWPEYKGWTSALQCVAKAYGRENLLDRDSTQRKIRRNLDEKPPDMDRRYAPVLNVLFPTSAFFRVVGPPIEIEDI